MEYVYHLRGDYGRSGGTTEFTDVAICYYYDGKESCMLDTQKKKLIEIINALEKSKEN